jgi:thioredoxin 1
MMDFNQSNFPAQVLKSEIPVLVDFWAPWCNPCKMVAPVIAEIATEYQGKIVVGKINVDDNQGLAEQYGVMSIPTICLFVKGQPVMKLVGFRPKKEIVAEMTKHLPS